MTKLVLATRKSPLALTQTEMVASHLRNQLGVETELLKIVTTGDKQAEWSLEQRGGKGLFTSELEAAVRSGEADVADDNHVSPCELVGPAGNGARPAQRSGNGARIQGEAFIRTKVDDRGGVRGADETDELVDGDRILYRHDASLISKSGRDASADASWGDRIPHGSKMSARLVPCQALPPICIRAETVFC